MSLAEQTLSEYKKVIHACEILFEKKTKDYGTAWRILRVPSITDQIFIKAQRIRSIQEKGQQMVEDDVKGEFVGIVNYCILGIIQMELPKDTPLTLPYEELAIKYQQVMEETMALLRQKNHDYGEAWREMRISSMTDLILMKLLRVKQIEDNAGKTLVSEGIKANYQDMINYAVFCMIKMEESHDK
jgi:hypothetical protein